jgi:hypothetical protein
MSSLSQKMETCDAVPDSADGHSADDSNSLRQSYSLQQGMPQERVGNTEIMGSSGNNDVNDIDSGADGIISESVQTGDAVIHCKPAVDEQQNNKVLDPDTVDLVLSNLQQQRKVGERWCLVALEWFDKWTKIYQPPPDDLNSTPALTTPAPMDTEAGELEEASIMSLAGTTDAESVASAKVPLAPLADREPANTLDDLEDMSIGKSSPVATLSTKSSSDDYVVSSDAPPGPIGPIDNSSLLDDEALKLGLLESNDYICLREDVFDNLCSFYGGGPKICRDVVFVSKGSGTSRIDIYPLELRIYACADETAADVDPAIADPNLVMMQSRYAHVKDICEWAAAALNESSSRVRLWVKVDDKTLASMENDLFNRARTKCLQLTEEIVSLDPSGWRILLESASETTLEELAAEYDTQHNHKLVLLLEIGYVGISKKSDDKLKDLIVWPRRKQANEWRKYIRVGDRVDARDNDKIWWEAVVAELIGPPVEKTSDRESNMHVRIHFRGWGEKFDAVFKYSDAAIQPVFSMTKKWRHEITVNSFVDLCSIQSGSRKWYPGKVNSLKSGTESGYVSVFVKSMTTDSFLQCITVDTDSEMIMPLHTHTKAQSCRSAIAELNAIDVKRSSTIDSYLTSSGYMVTSAADMQQSTNQLSGPNSKYYGSRTGPASATSTSSFNYEAGVVGLRNLGNTCFANSVLQCLNCIPEITEYFVSGLFRSHINSVNTFGSRGQLANAYFRFLQNCWSGKNRVIDNHRDIMHVIANRNPVFAGYEQHDSQV